jgi:hypothetical protein
MNSIFHDFKLVSVISTPFPWSLLKLHSNSTPWSGNGVEIQKSNGVGVGVGMELEILNFSETTLSNQKKR